VGQRSVRDDNRAVGQDASDVVELRANTAFIQHVLDWVEYVAIGIEVLAVAIIAISIAYATASHLVTHLSHRADSDSYRVYRRRIAEGLLLGLEILVAADIVRTVILDSTLESVAILGVLVLIRTFLTWSLVVEMEGRLPWRASSRRDS